MIQSVSTAEHKTEYLRRIANKPYFEAVLGTHLRLFGKHPASGWAFYLLPGTAVLELRGGNLLTDGCRRVLDFTPQRICLDMGDTLVTLYGADLRIESFAGKRLIAAGRFARIELRSKWEVPQE